MEIFWLEQTLGDVPEDNEWLSEYELERQAAMRFPKRRSEWRLGRWTAKLALCAWDGMGLSLAALTRNEVRSAATGAPEAFTAGERSPMAMSLSHSNGRALCVLTRAKTRVGCDLESLEPRSQEFVDDYFNDDEQRFIKEATNEDRLLLVNLIWSAKESALKALGVGLRESTHAVHIVLSRENESHGNIGPWQRFAVQYGSESLDGLWRKGTRFVRTIAAKGHISYASELRPICVEGTERARSIFRRTYCIHTDIETGGTNA